jgi:hypothetical protein
MPVARHTTETKAKMSEVLKGHEVSDETKKKLSQVPPGRRAESAHIRWHINGSYINYNCKYCKRAKASNV